MKRSKRYKESAGKVEKDKTYSVEDGLALLKEVSSTKFDETFDIVIELNVDPKHADQNVRGVVSLPHGTGKTKTVLVLTKGTKEKEAEEAGADYVGLEEYVEKFKKGWVGVDAIVATPDVMSEVGKLGKILGPRGLMPTPKAGTVTMDVGKAVQEIKAGRIEFRVEKNGILHTGIGKLSFDKDKLKDNLLAFAQAVLKLKPASAKGQYVKKIVVSSTMGPGIKIDYQEIAQLLK